MDYFREAKFVWDVIKENSQLVDKNNPGHYGK